MLAKLQLCDSFDFMLLNVKHEHQYCDEEISVPCLSLHLNRTYPGKIPMLTGMVVTTQKRLMGVRVCIQMLGGACEVVCELERAISPRLNGPELARVESCWGQVQRATVNSGIVDHVEGVAFAEILCAQRVFGSILEGCKVPVLPGVIAHIGHFEPPGACPIVNDV